MEQNQTIFQTFANIRTPQMKKVIVTGSETEGSVRWTR